jgi:periplasmic protein TonB
VTTAERYRLLRSGYYRRLELGIALALGIHILVFAVAPPYVPRPFRLRHDQPLRLVQTAISAAEPVVPEARALVPVTPPPPHSYVQSEQLVAVPVKTPNAAASASGTATGPRSAAVSGGGEGDTPPVFYAYDTAPRIVRRVEPEYPLSARVTGAEGTVVIDANIDESGKILRAWVAQSTAPEALVEAALDAIYQFEFLPGKQGSFPVKCTVAIPFRFSLKKI